MKRRKTVAVLTAQVESVYQKQLLEGILSEAFANDINVVVFSTFVKDGVWATYHHGECNIYNLIHYEKFDGIILVPDAICMEGKLEEVSSDIKENFRGPFISIDYQIPGADLVEHDTDSGIGLVINHLIREQKVRDIAFMTGYQGHPHGEARLQAFVKAMAENHLKIGENRQFYGDFWYNMGEEVLDKLINSSEGLPQAIACGSDAMALSIYDACVKRNIKVPEDLLITGYDANEEGANRPFFVTSSIMDSVTVGKNAVRKICLKWGLMKENNLYPISPSLVKGKTCRYEEETKMDKIATYHLGSSLFEGINTGFYSGYNFMMEDTIGAANIEDCLWKIDYYTHFIKSIQEFHICLNQDWRGDTRNDKEFRKINYSDDILWIYDKKSGRLHAGTEGHVDMGRTFAKEEILPAIWKERKVPAVFYVTPLHFMERSFGYTVLCYENKPVSYEREFCNWIRNVNNALESMRRQMNLQEINNELGEMYRRMEMNSVTDALTGVYNRNGFNSYASKMLELANIVGKNILVLLADINDLKGINDAYGHPEGDIAIKTAADALKVNLADSFDPCERCFRIGGDEFVIISIGNYNKNQIHQREEEIRNYLNEYNKNSGKKYQVMLSIGTNVGSPEGLTIDNILQVADQKMYSEKQWYKRMYKREDQ